MSDATTPAISFVVPVYDGGELLVAAVHALLAEAAAGPAEVLLVDDRSGPETRRILERLAAHPQVRLLDGAGAGAAAALDLGFRAARHPFVGQVDQDVVVCPGWRARLVEACAAEGVAAAQGVYRPFRGAAAWARIGALDLAERWRGLEQVALDHVASGNTVYRREAVLAVGGFDPKLGYGYDNDLSYRLIAAGWRLVLRPDAVARHAFPATVVDYLRRQYGQGYGRLDVVRKHPRKMSGDRVSGLGMIARVPLTAAALAAFAAAPFLRPSVRRRIAGAGAATLAALAAERAVAGWRAFRRDGDPAALAFPAAHLVRDLAWAAALAVWTARRLAGVRALPRHSMPRRGPRGEG